MSRSALERADHKKIQMLLRQQQSRVMPNNIQHRRPQFEGVYPSGSLNLLNQRQPGYGNTNPNLSSETYPMQYLQQPQFGNVQGLVASQPYIDPNLAAPSPLPYLSYPYLTTQTLVNTSSEPSTSSCNNSFSSQSHSQFNDSQTNRLPIILASEYYIALSQVTTFEDILAEISASVTHVEPWSMGTNRDASTAFCLLLKLLSLQLSGNQLRQMMTISDQTTAYHAAIAFLYLRYACDPKELWSWFGSCLNDDCYLMAETMISPSTDPRFTQSLSDYLKSLLTDIKYYGTTFPRVPTMIDRFIKMQLLLITSRRDRRKENVKWVKVLLRSCLEVDGQSVVVGSTKQQQVDVFAQYCDNDSEPAWYKAKIKAAYLGSDELSASTILTMLNDDEVNVDDLKFNVEYTDYGNEQIVDLGDIKVEPVVSVSRKLLEDGEEEEDNDDAVVNAGASKTMTQGLAQQVMMEAREASVSSNGIYASRPATYKGSLSLKMDSHTYRKKDDDDGRRGRSGHRRSRSRDRRSHDDDDEDKKKKKNQSKDQADLETRRKELLDMYGNLNK